MVTFQTVWRMVDPSGKLLILLVGIMLILLLTSGTTVMASEITTQNPTQLQWLPGSSEQFHLNGLPFFQEAGWGRLPARAEGKVPPAVWGLSRWLSGGRIRFRSNTSNFAVRVEYTQLPGGLANMHAFGQGGIDIYLDGSYVSTAAPRDATQVEAILFRNMDKKEREMTLYLPIYLGINSLELGLDADATIEPPTPFSRDLPVVFYGTSITQGGCASRSGMSYQAILCRRLNLDFVNLGFSGAGRGEKEVAELVSEVTAACYVLDFAQNHTDVASFEAVYLPFIHLLRSRHPQTPIICTTPIYSTWEIRGGSAEHLYPQMREVVRRAVETQRQSGDENIHLIEGFELLGPEQVDGLVDGIHPNDLGFQWMADGFEPHLKRILGLD